MRSFAVIVLIACVSCMEMHETVERMVMVRTTGSDLQPAATGFIYKKDSDGPASVVKMGESEVMEHLSKMYEQPKSFAAPIPVVVGPFYGKDEEDKLSAVSSESKIIPVVEHQEKKDDHIDGIADEDYGKLLEEYASDFGNYKTSLGDYLKSLEYFNDKINHGNGDGDNYHSLTHKKNGDSGKNDYGNIHQYNKDDAGDYSSAKYESYEVSKGDENKKDEGDDYGKHYAVNHKYKRNHGFQPKYSQSKEVNGFHKYFDADEYTTDQDTQNGEEIKGIHDYTESNADKFDKRGSNDAGFYEDGFARSHSRDKQSQEEDDTKHSGEKDGKPSQSQQYHNEFSFESGKHDGRSYGYQIKH